MGTVNATVLPVPVLEPPIQSLPFRISGIHALWIPVGFLISMDAREAESHGVTPREANPPVPSLIEDNSGTEGSLVKLERGVVVLALIRDAVATGGASFLLFLDPSWCSEISSSDPLGDA
jgi:hypothetical protein